MHARRERETTHTSIVVAIALLAIVAGITTFVIGLRQPTRPHARLAVEPATLAAQVAR